MLVFAIALTRAWTALYTRGLPPDLRAERREEIDCDLWEHRRAGLRRRRAVSTAAHILLRLALGIPADFVWRLETGAAVRAGRDPDMKDRPWTVHRVLALLFAIIVLPIPASWTRSASAALSPGMREESTLSMMLLGIGGQACLMPIILGLMTVFWDGISISGADLAAGSAEIAAGLAAIAGLYAARGNAALGIALIMGATLAMAFLAAWALPAVIAVGITLTVMAAVRWFAPAPMQTVEA